MKEKLITWCIVAWLRDEPAHGIEGVGAIAKRVHVFEKLRRAHRRGDSVALINSVIDGRPKARQLCSAPDPLICINVPGGHDQYKESKDWFMKGAGFVL